MSAGRYVLGLGASTQALAEGFHDVPFEHPARRLRDVLTAVRALLDGQPAELRCVQAARPLRLGQPPVPGLPIWVAALGPQATQVAAELSDGWIPVLAARDHLHGWAARLRLACARVAQDAPGFTVAAGPVAAAADDAAAARDVAASCVAWYLSAMGGVYARSVAAQGYSADVAAVTAANPRPSPRRGIIPQTSRLRDGRRGARAGRAVGSRGRHGHDLAASCDAMAGHRGDPAGRRPGRAASTLRWTGASDLRMDAARHCGPGGRPGLARHRRTPTLAAMPWIDFAGGSANVRSSSGQPVAGSAGSSRHSGPRLLRCPG